MNLHKIFVSFYFAFLLGCNYTKVKGSSNDANSAFELPVGTMSELSYGVIQQKVFLPKCVSCHGTSGQIRLETYSDIVQNLALIKKTVFDEKSMPKRGTLTSEELSYLWNWMKMGAPEQAQNGSATPPPAALPPIEPTFDSINSHVFQTSCKECHNPTGTGKRVMLDKDSLMNSPLELIIPGNPDESGLVVAIERSDDKRMPPAKEGYGELKSEVKVAIRKWIENGAKD